MKTRILFALTFAVTLVAADFTADQAQACGGRKRSCSRSYSNYRPAPRPVIRPVVVVKKVFVPAPQPQLPTVPAGATLTLPTNFLGGQPGNVFMTFANIKLPCQIKGWTDSSVTFTLPPMAIKNAVAVRLDVVLPHGKIATSQKVLVTAPPKVILHPVLPTSPLPTQDALAVHIAQ